MLLHSLRQSRTLARLMLVWLVLVVGVAVAAPGMQPVNLGAVCSTAVNGSDDGAIPAGHQGWQCIQCLNVGAPPVTLEPLQFHHAQPVQPLGRVSRGVTPSVGHSPVLARAPPRT